MYCTVNLFKMCHFGLLNMSTLVTFSTNFHIILKFKWGHGPKVIKDEELLLLLFEWEFLNCFVWLSMRGEKDLVKWPRAARHCTYSTNYSEKQNLLLCTKKNFASVFRLIVHTSLAFSPNMLQDLLKYCSFLITLTNVHQNTSI